MIKINPLINNTFLSHIINESVLNFCRLSKSIKEFSFPPLCIKLSKNLKDIFVEIYREIPEDKLPNIILTGNDKINSELFKYFGLEDVKSKKTIDALIKTIKEKLGEFKFKKEDIEIEIFIDWNSEIIIFEPPLKEEIGRNGRVSKSKVRKIRVSTPGLFKVDRFTGYTALEGNPARQLTQYFFGETALFLFLGLQSSFVLRKRIKDNIYYFFLFFSPEEIINLYISMDNRDLLRKYFLIKEKAIEILREVYFRTLFNEAALLELSLNLKIRELLNQHNLDKISFTLFKIAQEGQTYKIYEQIPITIFKDVPFIRVLEKYSRNPDEFIRKLSGIFESKNSRLWKALGSFGSQNKLPEADNVLRAMQGLYRFVILGDLSGYYQFMREIFNCYKKAKDDRSKEYYKQILENLRWL